MSTCTRVPLVDSVLLGHFNSDASEEAMVANAKLLIGLVNETVKQFLNNNPLEFDANPGDGACQAQALHLHALFQMPHLKEEAVALRGAIEQVKQHLQARRSGVKKEGSATEFFQREVVPLTLSEEMLYLLRLRLFKFTKVRDKVLPNGIVVTRTEPSKLDSFAPNRFGQERAQFVADAASRLAMQSILHMRAQEERLSCADPLRKAMFKEEQIHRPVVDPRFASKPFSCLFFQIEVLLQALKERGAVIAIKSIGKDPKHLFLQASASGFALFDPKSFSPEMPIVVFEAVVKEGVDLPAKVVGLGFEKMLLSCAAQEPPFNSTSTIGDVKMEQAKERIECARAQAKGLGLAKEETFFLLDHVFCSTMIKEGIACRL
jgi:hypothetical protein